MANKKRPDWADKQAAELYDDLRPIFMESDKVTIARALLAAYRKGQLDYMRNYVRFIA